MLLDQLGRALPHVRIDRAARRAKWVVFIKPAIQGTQRVLEYLGRYVHRIAISNSRIVSVTTKAVTFRYQDSADLKWKTLTLSGEEFLRRYLQHVLPQGFHKIRYYGLWAPANRRLLRQVQLLLPDHHQSGQGMDDATKASCERQCPRCIKGTMRLVAMLARQRCDQQRPRAPP
jgi:hypothetical protein